MAEGSGSAARTDRAVARRGMILQVQELLRILEAEDLSISAVYLYGSYAAGTAGAYSDIDVAVISPDLSGDRLQDWMHLNTLATRVDSRFEVIGFRPEQFRDEHPLAWEVKTHGILVKGDRL